MAADFLSDADALSAAAATLRDIRFTNPDVGPLNDLLGIDHFIISIPKCGTTAIQRGLERAGKPVIHTHTDASLFFAFPNGDELRNRGLGMANLLRARLAARPDPVHIYFGYREPVDWYLSVAGHFRLPYDQRLSDQIIPNLEFMYPWTNYRIDEIARIIEDATGVRLLSRVFDHEEVFTHIRLGHVNIVLYRFDRMDGVERYVAECVGAPFGFTQERVNAAPEYLASRETFSPSPAALERLYRDRWFRHFYRNDEAQRLAQHYLSRSGSTPKPHAGN
jgi:hypothetical protein